MFHVGHLNLLKRARARCKRLTVGVNTDELVLSYKDKYPIIPQQDRLAIVQALRVVDDALLMHTLDKLEAWHGLRFDAVFIGDDWRGSPRWVETERAMSDVGVHVEFLTYTPGISSTLIRAKLTEESDALAHAVGR
jgi:cytidyltransferase-like protein